MSRLPIDQEPDTLNDYHEEVKGYLIRLEELGLALERDPCNMALVADLREIFQQMFFSSTKLDLLPIGENLQIMVNVFDFILKHSCYPLTFSELLLRFIDQMMMTSEDVLENHSIDMLAVQNLHIALQHINLAETAEQLFEGTNRAIEQLSTEGDVAHAQPQEDDDVFFFDDFSDLDANAVLFDDEPSVEQQVEGESQIDEIELAQFSPQSEENPIELARRFMANKVDDPVSILAEMSDQLTCHGKRHTLYLQEIALAINYILGEPVEAEDLWVGLALHDIGLASMTERLNDMPSDSPEAFTEYQNHPFRGASVAKRMGLGSGVLKVIEQHHERIDGTGYPRSLSGSEISDEGRIAAVADVFHSRIYHHAQQQPGHSALLSVVDEIKRGSGTKYDSRVVKAFIYCMREFWVPRHVIKSRNSGRQVNFEN